MFGIDAPAALLVLLGGLALVATLSMRRMARDEADDGAAVGRRLDPSALAVGGLVILAAVVGAMVVLGIWP